METKKCIFINDNVLYATWNPVKNVVAYVRDRDIHLYDVESGVDTLVTQDGKRYESIFNGIADWVYEGRHLFDLSTNTVTIS